MGEKSGTAHRIVQGIQDASQRRRPPVKKFYFPQGLALWEAGQRAAAANLAASEHPESHPLPPEEEEAE